MGELTFWKQQPPPPSGDWRAWSLGMPSVLSSIGFVLFAILGYSFREFQMLPDGFRTWAVLSGAVCIAIGGELGTCSSTIEIFRKLGRTLWWDWTALVVSAITTLCAFVVAASYLPELQMIGWAMQVQTYGPAALMSFAVLDAYFTFAEFGLYLREYDERVVEYLAARESYDRREYNAILRQHLRDLTTEPREPGPRVRGDARAARAERAGRRATRDEWRELCADQNGDRAEMDGTRVNEILVAHGFARIPPSTARDWAELARETAQ